MATAILSNPQVEMQCELTVPDGFRVENRLNPNLAYPFELGGITNTKIPPGEASPQSGFPRVDLIPQDGVLLWIVAYDTTWEADSARSPKLDGAQMAGAPGLMSRASRPSRWDNVTWAQTFVDVSPTKRCQLFTFAGPSAQAGEAGIVLTPPDDPALCDSHIDKVAPSLRFQG